MPLQIPQIASFGDLVAAQDATNQSSRYATQSLINLGQSIGQSIEQGAAQKNAIAQLPALQQSYQQGIAKINSGYVGEGMGDIYAASVSAGQNPLLAPVAQRGIQTAAMAAQQQLHYQRSMAIQSVIGQRSLDNTYAKQGLKVGPDGQSLVPIPGFAKAASAAQIKPLNAVQLATMQKTAGETVDGNIKPLFATLPNPDPVTNADTFADQVKNPKTDFGDWTKTDPALSAVGAALKVYASTRSLLKTKGGADYSNPTADQLANVTYSNLKKQSEAADALAKSDPNGLYGDNGLIFNVPRATNAQRAAALQARLQNFGAIKAHIDNPQIPDGAIQRLNQDPSLLDAFNQKYGSGLGQKFLVNKGGQQQAQPQQQQSAQPEGTTLPALNNSASPDTTEDDQTDNQEASQE